ncbi:uncharacterized protein LOC144094804 isoform X2 [Amblyomma americanum]
MTRSGSKWMVAGLIAYAYSQSSVQKCDYDKQEIKQLIHCAKRHFDSMILRNVSIKVTRKIIHDVLRRENVTSGCRDPHVIAAIQMKVFLNFTTNMLLRKGIKKGKTMQQFSDCFTHLYE